MMSCFLTQRDTVHTSLIEMLSRDFLAEIAKTANEYALRTEVTPSHG